MRCDNEVSVDRQWGSKLNLNTGCEVATDTSARYPAATHPRIVSSLYDRLSIERHCGGVIGIEAARRGYMIGDWVHHFRKGSGRSSWHERRHCGRFLRRGGTRRSRRSLYGTLTRGLRWRCCRRFSGTVRVFLSWRLGWNFGWNFSGRFRRDFSRRRGGSSSW